MKKIFLLFLVLLFCVSCAPLLEVVKKAELKEPSAELALGTLARNTGYGLAKKFPALASDIIDGIEKLLKLENRILVNQGFPAWSEYILDIVDVDPFIKMNLRTLLDSVAIVEVDFDRTIDQYKVKADLVRKLLTDLVYGMKFYMES